MEDHSLRVIKKITIGSGTKYQLEECPFDSSHRNGDAAVFAFNNGCLGFHCFHNSCSSYHWHEFREKIEPAAYANSPYAIRPVQNISISQQLPIGKGRRKSFPQTAAPSSPECWILHQSQTMIAAKLRSFVPDCANWMPKLAVSIKANCLFGAAATHQVNQRLSVSWGLQRLQRATK